MSEKMKVVSLYIDSIPEFKNFFTNIGVDKYLLALKIISSHVDDFNSKESLYRETLIVKISMMNNF